MDRIILTLIDAAWWLFVLESDAAAADATAGALWSPPCFIWCFEKEDEEEELLLLEVVQYDDDDDDDDDDVDALCFFSFSFWLYDCNDRSKAACSNSKYVASISDNESAALLFFC